MTRYVILWWAFIKNCIVREMGFRLNFLAKVLFGSMWFMMTLIMFSVVFAHVQSIAGWTKYEVFFLMGVSHVILRLFETFFMENLMNCLLYTSDAADERSSVDLGGRRIIK